MGLHIHSPQPFLGSLVSARLAQFKQRSLIKSIQSGTVVCLDNALSGTATITAVNLLNSLIFFDWSSSTINTPNSASSTPSQYTCLLTFTNATTITLSRAGTIGAGAQSFTGRFLVVEFVPGVLRSVQRGTISIAGGASSNTATVTAVTTKKSLLVWLGNTTTTGTTDTLSDVFASLALTNATTITAARSGTSNNVTPGYQLAEFY